MTSSQVSLGAFPDSPYAVELRRGFPSLRFAVADLESIYRRLDLSRNRALIRVACTLAALLTIFRSLDQFAGGAAVGIRLIDLCLILGSSVFLAGLAWSSAFEQFYLPCACFVVPLRNAIVAAHVAYAVAHGQLEMLMVLPVLVIGPFFFLGLRFYRALGTAVLTLTAFILAAFLLHLALPAALRYGSIMTMGTIACAIAARHIEKASRTAFLEGQLNSDLARRDPLTGTKNRRVFDECLTRLWLQALEEGRALAILLIDVDHFKAYNDHYGHQAGDLALRSVAQSLQTFVQRPLDVLARYGGEEFAVILYDVDGEQAMVIAEDIHRAVSELAIEHRGSHTCARVTISVGVALIKPISKRNPRGALQLADQALYEAKAKGRNRVELMDDADYGMLVTGAFKRKSVSQR